MISKPDTFHCIQREFLTDLTQEQRKEVSDSMDRVLRGEREAEPCDH